MAGKVFISYSTVTPEPTKALAAFLEAEGYSVWWDTSVLSGESFDQVIRQIEAADAVVVIWTPSSVYWVKSEADRGHKAGKLVPLRTKDLDTSRIPAPYDTTYHTALVEDRQAVLAAVQRLAGNPPKAELPKQDTQLSPKEVWAIVGVYLGVIFAMVCLLLYFEIHIDESISLLGVTALLWWLNKIQSK